MLHAPTMVINGMGYVVRAAKTVREGELCGRSNMASWGRNVMECVSSYVFCTASTNRASSPATVNETHSDLSAQQGAGRLQSSVGQREIGFGIMSNICSVVVASKACTHEVWMGAERRHVCKHTHLLPEVTKTPLPPGRSIASQY